MTSTFMRTKEQYAEAFQAECARVYPEVSAFEQSFGFAVPRVKLEAAARVLACPLKVNPPSWQHGRVIYALARSLLEDDDCPGCLLDIGTAKGFSAVVMSWAIADAGARRDVVSVDVVDPFAYVERNSVAEMDGELLTVPEFVAPFLLENGHIQFHGGGSLPLLDRMISAGERVRLAFVDGKHTATAVSAEIACLLRLQIPGDVVLFDDVQIAGVAEAVRKISSYTVTRVNAGVNRAYAMAVRT